MPKKAKNGREKRFLHFECREKKSSRARPVSLLKGDPESY